MLFSVFLTIHIITCILMIIVVLMQSSKGGGLSGAFGGGMGGDALLGGRETATFLSKLTTYLAVIFMVTSLSLAFLSAGRGGNKQESVLKKAAGEQKWGTMVPEEQKDIEDVLGTLPGEEAAEDTSGS